MRRIYMSNGSSIVLKETDFLNTLHKYMEEYNIKTLEEMIELSIFEVNGDEYTFRYSDDLTLDIYDLYREYIEDGHEKYSLKNPDIYNFDGFTKDDKFRFKLSLKENY